MFEKTERTTQTIQSVERAIAVLRSFTEVDPELRVTELGRRLNLNKSTVSRIMATLAKADFVSQNPETGKYRLGVGLISLAGVALGRLDVRGVSQPHLQELVDLSRETVNVTVLDGNECVNVERARSPQPIRYVGWIGRRTPPHCTAAGKVLMAHLTPAELNTCLTGSLTAYTEKTIVDPETLRQSLERIHLEGYAIVHEEFEEGFSAIAAPIFDHTRRAVAAVSISGPTYRMGSGHAKTFIEPLLGVTGRISADMGFVHDPVRH